MIENPNERLFPNEKLYSAINERLRALLDKSEYKTVKEMCDKNGLFYNTVNPHFKDYSKANKGAEKKKTCPAISFDLLFAYSQIFNTSLDYIVFGDVERPVNKQEITARALKNAVDLLVDYYGLDAISTEIREDDVPNYNTGYPTTVEYEYYYIQFDTTVSTYLEYLAKRKDAIKDLKELNENDVLRHMKDNAFPIKHLDETAHLLQDKDSTVRTTRTISEMQLDTGEEIVDDLPF